ncbi:hypothetical protein Cgig2_009734 [Carnegiea gigantea]|uniref:Uncharacterized protein n=1 Tax=Carnegiea gigantea TaxID=171969 RepID=A0A9Q1K024_9CARY|nr:hypothetical protein Cgig2_009734 [Carnegiea gigantea]
MFGHEEAERRKNKEVRQEWRPVNHTTTDQTMEEVTIPNIDKGGFKLLRRSTPTPVHKQKTITTKTDSFHALMEEDIMELVTHGEATSSRSLSSPIDYQVEQVSSLKKFHITFIYGLNKDSSLGSIADNTYGARCARRDFNAILSFNDILGGDELQDIKLKDFD